MDNTTEIRWPGIHKLVEEMAELTTELAKLAAYPLGNHPDGKGWLIQRVADEMADVQAIVQWFENNNVEIVVDEDRIQDKYDLYSKWHEHHGMQGIVVEVSVNTRGDSDSLRVVGGGVRKG